MTNWYAIQTKPARENLAAANLSRMGIEVLLPKIRHEKKLWGNLQMVAKPLFASYLFAKFSPASCLHSIRYARGVRRVVGAGDYLFPVDETIIQAIKDRVGPDGYVCLGETAFQPGERVSIQTGPLQGLTGIFERELSAQQRVVILLDMIAYQAHVIIERPCVKALGQTA